MKIAKMLKTALQQALSMFVVSKRSVIYFKCPYMKSECTEYDSGSATLLTDCKDCQHYDKGIRASKF